MQHCGKYVARAFDRVYGGRTFCDWGIGMSLEGEAKALLNNEALTAAFEAVRTQALTAAMYATDDTTRRDCLSAARIVDGVKSHLAAVIQAGENEQEVKRLDNIADYYTLKARARWNATSHEAMQQGVA